MENKFMTDDKNPSQVAGSDVFNNDPPQEGQEPQQQADPAKSGDQAKPSDQQSPVADVKPSLTAEDIATAIKKAGLGQATPTKQPEKQYSQEDFNRAMNVFDPTPQQVEAILKGGEDAVAALRQIVGGVNKQSLTMASYMIQQAVEQEASKIREEFGPARTFAQQQQEEKLKVEFVEKHPDLKGYEPLLVEVVGQMKASGFNAETKEEAFKALADRARAVIKSLPGMKPANGDGKPDPTTSRMPTLSSGGQGGIGGGTTTKGKSKGPPGMEVFD